MKSLTHQDQVAELLESYNPEVLLDAVRRINERNLLDRAKIGSPSDTIDYLRDYLQGQTRELFVVIFLDTRHRVIACETLFKGTIDGACVYPRIVAERALKLNAAAVILAHNHPSGESEPSLADQAITRRLKDSLSLLEVRLLDHFVIGAGEPVSFACRGLL